MKRSSAAIEADLARARTERETLEHDQAAGKEEYDPAALDAARQREETLEAELTQNLESEPDVFGSYFGAEEERDAEPGTVFETYFDKEESPGQETPGLFEEMAKEEGLMDRLTEHAVDAARDKMQRDQEPEM